MLQLIHCENCKAGTTPPDAVTAEIRLSRTKYCDSCRHPHNETDFIWFCSPGCMLNWLESHETDFSTRVSVLKGQTLKHPEQFFTDPKPSTVIQEAKAAEPSIDTYEKILD